MCSSLKFVSFLRLFVNLAWQSWITILSICSFVNRWVDTQWLFRLNRFLHGYQPWETLSCEILSVVGLQVKELFAVAWWSLDLLEDNKNSAGRRWTIILYNHPKRYAGLLSCLDESDAILVEEHLFSIANLQWFVYTNFPSSWRML